ncbi:hypothetical protein LCGC14_1176080 [marine sediment metagenome]|uniref:Uncharacterized protein n=1 Tax=marine sediment metagenome TaxID=412755 RepID=A0A0F9P6I9_9ZZZZ
MSNEQPTRCPVCHRTFTLLSSDGHLRPALRPALFGLNQTFERLLKRLDDKFHMTDRPAPIDMEENKL